MKPLTGMNRIVRINNKIVTGFDTKDFNLFILSIPVNFYSDS